MFQRIIQSVFPALVAFGCSSQPHEPAQPTNDLDQYTLARVERIPTEKFHFAINPKSLKATDYPTPVLALRTVLTTNKPQIIAIGDTHSAPWYQGRTAFESFVEILPELAKAGYTDLVVEKLPFDPTTTTPSDGYVAAYLEILKNNNPELYSLRKQELEALTAQCRRLRITLHGAGASLQATEVFFASEKTLADMKVLADMDRDHGLAVIEALASKGRKTIYFGGMMHVPPYPEILADSNLFIYSFGDDLVRDGYSYTAVDPVFPSLLSAMINRSLSEQGAIEEPLARSLLFFYKNNFIPPQGKVRLLEASSSFYYLVYPFSR